jgi:nucleoside-diphosphate-sugar epimerase
MKILILGADGFIGSHVCVELEKNTNNEIYGAVRSNELKIPRRLVIDLLKKEDILNAINSIRPEVIVNCAGIVDVKDNIELNSIFSKNIIETAKEFNCVKRIILSGSAGEYGLVNPNELPINEEVPLRAEIGYGYSKLIEEKTALSLVAESDLEVDYFKNF